jgi:hypothetical protein
MDFEIVSELLNILKDKNIYFKIDKGENYEN